MLVRSRRDPQGAHRGLSDGPGRQDRGGVLCRPLTSPFGRIHLHHRQRSRWTAAPSQGEAEGKAAWSGARVGIEGRVGIEATAELAALAEELGYESLVQRQGQAARPYRDAGGRAGRRRSQSASGSFSARRLAGWDASRRGSPRSVLTPRIILGIAAGQIREHVIALTREALASRCSAAVPECRIATGYGPLMLKLGGRGRRRSPTG